MLAQFMPIMTACVVCSLEIWAGWKQVWVRDNTIVQRLRTGLSGSGATYTCIIIRKRLHAGYAQKAEARKTYHLTLELALNNTCVWFIGHLLHTYTLTPQFTFNINFPWSKRNLYIKHFNTSDADLSFILGSNN